MAGTLRPWLKVEVYNLFNNQKLIRWNTAVTPDPNSPTDALDLPTAYLEGPNFGKATAPSSFPTPLQDATGGGRTFRVAVGFRVGP